MGPRYILSVLTHVLFAHIFAHNPSLSSVIPSDYEQQRLHLLRKHGIDLEDSLSDGARTKRLDRSDIDKLMGGDGKGGIFTWREKNRRKARVTFLGSSRSR